MSMHQGLGSESAQCHRGACPLRASFLLLFDDFHWILNFFLVVLRVVEVHLLRELMGVRPGDAP
jgi:hypothetical protein